jgi:hypothetical protein
MLKTNNEFTERDVILEINEPSNNKSETKKTKSKEINRGNRKENKFGSLIHFC